MDANVTQLFKNDERAYLEFCALYHIRELKRIAPNHPLVEAVEAKLDELKKENSDTAPVQLDLFD